MSLLKIAENSDPNYLATVICIPEIKNHPNADKLEIVEIFGNTIIIGKGSYAKGEKVVYFPIETSINRAFLSWGNLLDKAELNRDGVTVGYFGKHSRVKAINLRGVPSQGFLFKVSELAKYYEVDENDFKVGDNFNVVGSDILVTKYVKETKISNDNPGIKKSRVPKWLNTTIGFFPRPIRTRLYNGVNYWYLQKNEGIKNQIVDGQFKFHYSTEHLGRNIFILNPDDYISILAKLHGTSSVFSNILCKKPFNPIRSLGRWIGFDLDNTEYKFVYSSRSVLKNRRDGKYTDDVWGNWASVLDGIIPPGISLYGEIVGYTPTGKTIQKNYDYGCAKNTSMLYIYRITETFSDGEMYEFSFKEIQDFCKTYGLVTVPLYYQGIAKDMFDIPVDENWNNNFLTKLKDTYLDKTCEFCTTGVINEGVVLKINNKDSKPVFKFKSPSFNIMEGKLRDENYEDIEEIS